jgi:POT family proton-dependent oligopeptide transporter
MGLTYDQQRPGNITLRANAFLWFYFSINVGSTLSMLALPFIRSAYGYQVAFAFPAALMAMALAVFAIGKKHYATEVIGPPPPRTPEQRAEQWKVLMGLLGIFGLMVPFWIVYEHNDNLWVEFAGTSMEMPTLGSVQIKPDQFQFINAALILVFVPLSQWFWPKVDPTGTRFPHTTKMFIGFVFTAAAPAVMAFAAHLASDGSKVSVWWLVLAYFVLTVGEVLLYGTGLDLSYGYAPKSMKGFVTACFLVTNAVGNLINMLFVRAYHTADANSHGFLDPQSFFALDTAIALGAAVAFYFVGRQFTRAHGPMTAAA